MVGKLQTLNLLKPRTERGATRKLNGDEVQKILFWIASFVKPDQIVDKVREEFGVSIHKKTVDYYKYNDEYKKTIEVMRKKWGANILNVEMTHKRRRLEELERIYSHCMNTDQMKSAITALQQIKNEVEKDLSNLNLTQYNVNIYKDMSDEELERERLKSLNRLKQLKGQTEEVHNAVREQEVVKEEIQEAQIEEDEENGEEDLR